MITSLYISVKLEEFTGVENKVGEGLAHVGSARTYVAGSIEGGRVSDMWTMLIVFFVTTLVSIQQIELRK